MTDLSDELSLPRLRQPALNPFVLTAVITIMAVTGVGLVLRFASVEQERATIQWQNKLNLIADSRAADVTHWLDHNFQELENVAGNPSLQLYLNSMLNNPAAKAGEEPAEASYMRALISITADRMGYTAKPSNDLKSINADVQKPTGVGLAVLDGAGKLMVSTSDLGAALDDDIAKKVAAAPKDQSSLIDLYLTPTGETRIGFILPIFPVSGQGATPQSIGTLVAIKNVDNSFYSLMQHPGATERTLEAMLLRKDGDNVDYLSPRDAKQHDVPTMSLASFNLDAAYAVMVPGDFASKIDRTSHATLMTSRAIPRSPWVLMLHIDRDQALAESDHRRQEMEAVMVLVLLTVIGGMVAVWYYGTSRRSLLLSLETARLAARLRAQEKMLRVVADNQLEPILIVDRKNIAHFANEKAALTFRTPSTSIVGKNLASLMGTARAEDYGIANRSASESGKPFVRTWRTSTDPHAQVIQSEHVPLPHIPIDSLPYPYPGVLIIDQDVTTVVHERERRIRTQQQIVNTLLYLVDKRDPHAANHSMGVAVAAREMANEMQLDEMLAATAEIAGKLMNIGKIMVPSKLLVKESALAEEEIKFIRESLQASVAVLEGIDFEGPVVDTLRQMQERYDGKGLLGIKGDNILVTARIISVANAFVGMISARSYRAAIGADQAITLLLQSADTQYDRRAVVALANFIANKRGKETLGLIMTQGLTR